MHSKKFDQAFTLPRQPHYLCGHSGCKENHSLQLAIWASLLDFLTFRLILSTSDCNVDISEQLIHQLNNLVLCRLSTSLALSWPAEIFLVYCVHHNVGNLSLCLTVFGRQSCLKSVYPLEYSTRYEITISGVHHSLRANSSNMSRKLRKARKQFLQLRSFIRSPKNTSPGLKPLKIAFFFPPLFQTIMDKSLETLLRFWGVFQFMDIQPSPHPTNNVGCVYPEFFPSFNFVSGGGRQNCKKIVKRMHCFKREPRITEKYEYCSTVPDCSIY